MFEFGRYTLSYQPPEGAVEADVTMSICSSADLPEMLTLFENFLQASGYILDGRELTLERKAPEFDFSDTPFTFGDNMLSTSSPEIITFGASNFAGMWGGMSEDTIRLG